MQIARVKGIERLSMGDLRALAESAQRIGIDPSWLAAVMSFESGLNPAARNASSSATGLIQFMPSTARALGTSIDSLRAMSFADQLPYVERYFAPYQGRMHSVEDTYLAVFYPAAMRMAPGDIIARQGEPVYDQNAGFDSGGTGVLTRRMITSTISRVLANGQAQGYIDVPMGTGWKVPLILLVLAGGYLVWQGYAGRRAKLLAEEAVHELERELSELKELAT